MKVNGQEINLSSSSIELNLKAGDVISITTQGLTMANFQVDGNDNYFDGTFTYTVTGEETSFGLGAWNAAGSGN